VRRQVLQGSDKQRSFGFQVALHGNSASAAERMYFYGYHMAADACYTAGFGGTTRVKSRREFSLFGECQQAFSLSLPQPTLRVLRAAEHAP
jgi:hypothetical protein